MFLPIFAKELGFQLVAPDPEADFQIQCLKEFLGLLSFQFVKSTRTIKDFLFIENNRFYHTCFCRTIQDSYLTLSFLVKKLDDTEIVTLEDFGKALEWFGPLEPGKSILQRMEYLVLFK